MARKEQPQSDNLYTRREMLKYGFLGGAAFLGGLSFLNPNTVRAQEDVSPDEVIENSLQGVEIPSLSEMSYINMMEGGGSSVGLVAVLTEVVPADQLVGLPSIDGVTFYDFGLAKVKDGSGQVLTMAVPMILHIGPFGDGGYTLLMNDQYYLAVSNLAAENIQTYRDQIKGMLWMQDGTTQREGFHSYVAYERVSMYIILEMYNNDAFLNYRAYWDNILAAFDTMTLEQTGKSWAAAVEELKKEQSAASMPVITGPRGEQIYPVFVDSMVSLQN